MRNLYSTDPEEQLANAFVMYLLMPTPLVAACESLHMTTAEMARRFAVDEEVMAVRRQMHRDDILAAEDPSNDSFRRARKRR